MKGNKITEFIELKDPKKLKRYIDWQFSNLRMCSTPEKQRERFIS